MAFTPHQRLFVFALNKNISQERKIKLLIKNMFTLHKKTSRKENKTILKNTMNGSTSVGSGMNTQ